MSDSRPTRYGFYWNGTRVNRLLDDPKWGILIQVNTPRQNLCIRVTPTGLIRVGEVRKGQAHIMKDEEL